MSAPQTYRQHLRATLALGLPLIGSHLAQFAITLTDTIMLGRYGIAELAAGVLGSSMFFVLFIFGSGFAFAVMPMVATAAGAGEDRQVRRVTRMGLWLSSLYALATLPVFLNAAPILKALGQPPNVALLAEEYLRVAGIAMLPAMIAVVLKNYLAALERTRVVLWITLVAVAVNALADYALIFGRLGAPEMGMVGAAWASLAVQVVSGALLMAYAARSTPEHALFQRLWRPDWEAFGAVFRLGLPIGLTNLAEVGLFAATSVMMGWLGTVQLAAHGIALQIASSVFMVHLGLSSAATIRTGRALGRGAWEDLRRGAGVAVALSMATAVLTVLAFLVIPGPLIDLFLDPAEPARAEVLAIGTTLLAAAALFQLVDAGQVMALGLLRGMQDTRVPMVMAAISYWVVGMPVSYLLGFTLGWGGPGIWLGLALGLAFAAVQMMTRFWRRARVAA